MSAKKVVFDTKQGHRDHFESILDGITIEDFFETLPNLLGNANLLGKTDGKISCNLGKNYPSEMEFALLGDTENPGRVTLLLGCSINNEKHELLSLYPEYDGAEVEVKLTEIHEWANGVEATLEGIMLNGERDIAFLDTRYCLNKGNYRIGETYIFKLSAFVYNEVEILQNPTIKFEGKDAVEHLKKIGKEVEYEPDGSVKPVIYYMEKMVAFFQASTAYPHLAEFQSPIFKIEEKNLFNGNFYKFDVAIARSDDDDEDIVIPLIAKKSLFTATPKEKEPLQGMMWLQGYCAVNPDNPQSVTKKNCVILKWNPTISSYSMSNFKENILRKEIYSDWSIYEYEKVKRGDRFFMLKVGAGTCGIVASGTITGNPAVGEDWSGQGRKIYYADYKCSFMVNPEALPILESGVLSDNIPEFDWNGGHSGAVLKDEQANILYQLFDKYLNDNAAVFTDRLYSLEKRGIGNDQLYIAEELLHKIKGV